MSVQLGILLILSSHPDGYATIDQINADTRLLSGADWSRKLRTLARRTGPIQIFRDQLAARESGGWRLTEAGRALLATLAAAPADETAAAAAARLRLVASQDTPRTPSAARATLALAKTA
jgi:hypothetical protein